MQLKSEIQIRMFQIKPIGDQGLIIQLPQEISPQILSQVLFLKELLEEKQKEWKLPMEFVPAYASLTVYFEICQVSYEEMEQRVRCVVEHSGEKRGNLSRGKLIEIPVCYGGAYGEDLAFVAEHNHLTPEEVIRIHTSQEYLVYMLGFLPGFPYLGGLDPRLVTPRKQTPRVRIPAGSVGIGGEQTGIYPVASPGGWQLIGQTPIKLFRADPQSGMEVPIYQAGDRIRFYPITEQEYISWR